MEQSAPWVGGVTTLSGPGGGDVDRILSGERWWSKLIQPRIGPNVGLRTVPNHSV